MKGVPPVFQPPENVGGGGGERKGLFPSFSLSEGKGPGDEVEHMSLREKCKQRFVYESGSDDNLVLRENPRDEKGAKGETGRGESFPYFSFSLFWCPAHAPRSSVALCHHPQLRGLRTLVSNTPLSNALFPLSLGKASNGGREKFGETTNSSVAEQILSIFVTFLCQ